jgi:hypothetical protein
VHTLQGLGYFFHMALQRILILYLAPYLFLLKTYKFHLKR